MLNKPLKDLTFTVIDTETTGMSPKYARLLEISAVKINPTLSIDKGNYFSTLINPECKIDYSAYRVHGISENMVKDKPFIYEVLPEFNDFVKDTVLVAHNAKFDMGFLNYAYNECSISPQYLTVIDTIKLSKIAFPNLRSYSLDNMIQTLNINISINNSYRHRALFDALHTASLLVKCINNLELLGIRYIYDL